MPDITQVTSDHADPSLLDTTSAGGQTMVSVFTIDGMPNVDPLQLEGSSEVVTQETLLSIPAVWRAVSFIARTLANLPKIIYQKTEGVPKKLDDHWLKWTLNQQPSELNTPATFWATFFLGCLLHNNGYAAIRRAGAETELYNVPPKRMIPFRFQGRQWYAFDNRQPSDGGKPGTRWLIFASDEILHVPGLSLDGMAGVDAMQLHGSTYKTARATEKYVGKYYRQGGLMGGAVESDQKLTKDQIKEMINLIRNEYSGEHNAHKWMVLSQAKAHMLSNTLDSAQTDKNRQFGVLEIARIYGVPPHLLYDLGRATWANVEQLAIECIRFTLSSWIVPTEMEIDRKLLSRTERRAGVYTRFETKAVQRGDHAGQIDGATKRVNAGLTTPDEERAEWDLPPYPDGIGSRPRVSANTLPLDPEAKPPASPAGTKPADGGVQQARLITPAAFEQLVSEASARVAAKTAAALGGARKRYHGAPPAQFAAWAQGFADEQRAYARAAVGPIVELFFDLTHCPGGAAAANAVGERYRAELARHCAQVADMGDSVAPDLKAIAMEALGAKPWENRGAGES